MDLFNGDVSALEKAVTGYSFTDSETQQAMRNVFKASGYVMDPHGAVGYLGLKKYMREVRSDVTGMFLETAHPAKFKEVVDETLGKAIEIPATLQKFLNRSKQTRPMSAEFTDFKKFLSKEF